MTDKVSFDNRVFKLSNGEEINPLELEKQITDVCHYVKYAIVGGENENKPVALIFPNKKFFTNPEYEILPEEGCFCPRNLSELGKCLHGCLKVVNFQIDNDHKKLKSATIINKDFEDGKSENQIEKYRSILHNKFGKSVPDDEEIYVINLEKK
ncbi:MAG: hypothetical protein WCO54_07845 [Bacteroidota bacterium]